jgi:hypothetical protein
VTTEICLSDARYRVVELNTHYACGWIFVSNAVSYLHAKLIIAARRADSCLPYRIQKVY